MEKADFAVIGDPIEHSLSPQIHALFANQFDIPVNYTRMRVQASTFEDVVNQFFINGGRGLNVTSPLKELACRYADLLTDRALKANAVNTLHYVDKDIVIGDSTDGVGLVRALQNLLHMPLQNQRILLLGAGGAIRGCLDELLRTQPAHVAIYNRTHSRAQDLVKQYAHRTDLSVLPEDFDDSLAFDIVINGTSASAAAQRPAINPRYLQGALCYDMMYGENAQPFLKWSLAQGASAAHDGLSMLVEQAAESFFIWQELRPSTEQVYARLRKGSAKAR